MRPRHVLGLVALAAIWGGSFIFMRVLVPSLGALATAGGRALIAGVALAVYAFAIGHKVGWRRYWREYLVIGAVNSAVPFALFAFAANHLSAGYSAILNSTAPLFGTLFSALWLGERLTVPKMMGVVLGTLGVAAIAHPSGASNSAGFGLSIAACLAASVCYAVAAVYVKKYASEAPPLSVSAATQVIAGLLIVPFIPVAPPQGAVDVGAIALLVAFALSASGVAFLIYFRLIADIGATRALTVTFLMPPFGLLFGALFLREPVTAAALAGCALVVAGTALVLRPGGAELPAPSRQRA